MSLHRPAAAERPLIVLLGATTNTDNYGVRVVLSSKVQNVVHAFPHARIISLDYGPRPTLYREQIDERTYTIEVINVRYGALSNRNNIFRLLAVAFAIRLLPKHVSDVITKRNHWLRRLSAGDAYLAISGGDSFSDVYGLRRFIYVTVPQLLVLALGKPLIQLPQTYGPYRTQCARAIAKLILKHSCVLYSRDDSGYRVIRRLVPIAPADVRVTPDVGLRMAAAQLPHSARHRMSDLRARGTIAGLNVSSLLYIGGYDGRNMFGLREHFPELVDKVIVALASKPGLQVLLIPHVCGGPLSQEDETHLCRDLLARHSYSDCALHYIDEPMTHRQIKSLIGLCDVFVGARMHACIAAVSQSVPTICLAYSDKFAGVMAPLGAGVRVVDLRYADADAVLCSFEEVLSTRSVLRSDLASHLQRLPSFAAELRASIGELIDPRTRQKHVATA